MSLSLDHKHTVAACYIGYITQAIVNNYLPLLFVMFSTRYHLSPDKIGLLVTVNFATQLLVDLISSVAAQRLGTRRLIVAAHALAAAGLVMLGVLPDGLESPYLGLCISVVVYALGGGLIEVLISPILEGCPAQSKSAAMSLLHSFYCWGSVAVVLSSTAMFSLFGIDFWRIAACIWAVIPLFNMIFFCFVPIYPTVEEGRQMSVKQLLSTGVFWLLAVLMVCAGASELAMSQWASAFAEKGLGVSKTLGDLAGPCFFAVLMGLSRVFHGRYGDKYPLFSYLGVCALLCILGYLVACLSPVPALSLAGCGICGLSVGAMWPGTFSLAAKRCPRGGIAMYALLALAGDCGCAGGPAMVGFITRGMGDDLRSGLIWASIFPAVMIFALVMLSGVTKKIHK
ncbi:MAG: MFS transporter [Ruminococcus sp.]|nr:MFS transporter [Ruminococcus sp.]